LILDVNLNGIAAHMPMNLFLTVMHQKTMQRPLEEEAENDGEGEHYDGHTDKLRHRR
jgi:hypothetical protein